jgi:hypothetical protein
MNPTLTEALATLSTHIEWHQGYDYSDAYAVLTLDDIVLRLTVTIGHTGRCLLSASISSHDGPHIRVSLGDRPDLLSAWTEVREVVARVDAAAGAAMAGTPPA